MGQEDWFSDCVQSTCPPFWLLFIAPSTARASFSADDKANTRLLLGMCLDTYARYLLFSQQPSQAQRMYEKALRISEEILGERHLNIKNWGESANNSVLRGIGNLMEWEPETDKTTR